MTCSRINLPPNPRLLQLPHLNWLKLHHQLLPLLPRLSLRKYNLVRRNICSSIRNLLLRKTQSSKRQSTYLSTILNQLLLLPKRRLLYQSLQSKSRNKLNMLPPRVLPIKLLLKLYLLLQMLLRNNLLPQLKRHQRRKSLLQSPLSLLPQQFQ